MITQQNARITAAELGVSTHGPAPKGMQYVWNRYPIQVAAVHNLAPHLVFGVEAATVLLRLIVQGRAGQPLVATSPNTDYIDLTACPPGYVTELISGLLSEDLTDPQIAALQGIQRQVTEIAQPAWHTGMELACAIYENEFKENEQSWPTRPAWRARAEAAAGVRYSGGEATDQAKQYWFIFGWLRGWQPASQR